MTAKMVCILVVVFLFSFLTRGVSAASVDNLEDVGPDSTIVSQRVIDGVVVDISVGSNGSMVAGTYDDCSPYLFGGVSACNDPLNPAHLSGNRFIGAHGGDIRVPTITFDFSSGLSEFGLTTIDLLENAGGASDWVTLRAFNGQGAVVDEHTRVGPQGASGLDLDWEVTSDDGDIVRVMVLSSISDNGGHGFDDIIVIPAAPIPTLSNVAMVLLVGLLMAAGCTLLIRRNRLTVDDGLKGSGE